MSEPGSQIPLAGLGDNRRVAVAVIRLPDRDPTCKKASSCKFCPHSKHNGLKA